MHIKYDRMDEYRYKVQLLSISLESLPNSKIRCVKCYYPIPTSEIIIIIIINSLFKVG